MASRVRALIAITAISALGNGCAAGPGLAARADTDSAATLTVLYRTALANALKAAGGNPAVICAGNAGGDPPAAVLAALADSTPALVRPRSACRIDPLSRQAAGASLVVDTLTGRRGIAITADSVTTSADGGLTFRTGYYQGGRSAATWECTARWQGAAWQVEPCRLTRIS